MQKKSIDAEPTKLHIHASNFSGQLEITASLLFTLF